MCACAPGGLKLPGYKSYLWTKKATPDSSSFVNIICEVPEAGVKVIPIIITFCMRAPDMNRYRKLYY